MTRNRLLLSYCSLSLFLIGCGGDTSSGNSAGKAQPGTPAFFWAAAKQSWQSGDYTRTAENLSKITSSENEFKPRAEAWLILVSTGLTQGYLDAAEVYDLGARQNPKNATQFRKLASSARTMAKATVLQSVESLHDFTAKVKDDPIAIDATPPTGTLSDPPVLSKISKGMNLAEGEFESAQKTLLQRGVLASACRAAGSPDDSAKTNEKFRQQPVQLARGPFLLGMASALEKQMALFGPKQLDDPIRQKLIATEALEAAKLAPATKESKDLIGKLEKAIKGIKTAS